MQANWYPGHMKKTIEDMKNSLRMVDLVAVLLDARIPRSSKNPIVEKLIGNKPRIYLLNKSDLADESQNKLWKEEIEKEGHPCLVMNAKDPKIAQKIEKCARKELEDKFRRDRERNIKSKKIRLMIVGIPNVGKSTLINTIAKRAGARVGDRPGVTTSKQWIKQGDIEFLDTPGILWPTFDNEETKEHLSYTQAMKDESNEKENLAYSLIKTILEIKPEVIFKRYELEKTKKDPLAIMDAIGERRGAIMRGGLIDYDRVASIILDEYRKGLWGPITLEPVKNV